MIASLLSASTGGAPYRSFLMQASHTARTYAMNGASTWQGGTGEPVVHCTSGTCCLASACAAAWARASPALRRCMEHSRLLRGPGRARAQRPAAQRPGPGLGLRSPSHRQGWWWLHQCGGKASCRRCAGCVSALATLAVSRSFRRAPCGMFGMVAATGIETTSGGGGGRPNTTAQPHSHVEMDASFKLFEGDQFNGKAMSIRAMKELKAKADANAAVAKAMKARLAEGTRTLNDLGGVRLQGQHRQELRRAADHDFHGGGGERSARHAPCVRVHARRACAPCMRALHAHRACTPCMRSVGALWTILDCTRRRTRMAPRSSTCQGVWP